MTNSRHSKGQKGFTLLEVLLIVAVVALLAGIAAVAINPHKQLGDSRNNQRKADVALISNAVHQYLLSNKQEAMANLSSTPTEICASDAPDCTNLVDLRGVTRSSKYVTVLPKDPQCGEGSACKPNGTGYKISKDQADRITVIAPAAEQHKRISATR